MKQEHDGSTSVTQIDAADALAVGLCHAHRIGGGALRRGSKSWAAFVRDNPDRIRG